jgi:hypothetical protein
MSTEIVCRSTLAKPSNGHHDRAILQYRVLCNLDSVPDLHPSALKHNVLALMDILDDHERETPALLVSLFGHEDEPVFSMRPVISGSLLKCAGEMEILVHKKLNFGYYTVQAFDNLDINKIAGLQTEYDIIVRQKGPPPEPEETHSNLL